MNLIFVRPGAKTTKICFNGFLNQNITTLPESQPFGSPAGLKAGVCSGLILSAPFTLL